MGFPFSLTFLLKLSFSSRRLAFPSTGTWKSGNERSFSASGQSSLALLICLLSLCLCQLWSEGLRGKPPLLWSPSPLGGLSPGLPAGQLSSCPSDLLWKQYQWRLQYFVCGHLLSNALKSLPFALIQLAPGLLLLHCGNWSKLSEKRMCGQEWGWGR